MGVSATRDTATGVQSEFTETLVSLYCVLWLRRKAKDFQSEKRVCNFLDEVLWATFKHYLMCFINVENRI